MSVLEKIDEEELEFMEDWYNPAIMAECLFSDYDNLALHGKARTHLRLGQFTMLSYEYMLDENPEWNDKKNFKMREGAGTVYALGGRKFGKTLIVEKVDLLISFLCLEAERCGFTSIDAIHIRGVLEEVIQVLENHPLFQMLKPKITRSPAYRFSFRTGYVMEGINMNLSGKKPGEQFFQKHLTRLYIEESSFETDEVYKKRIDAVSENGCVVRGAGMTNFTKYMPAGRIFYDIKQKPRIVNLPQYVNPKWDDAQDKEAIKEHGGRQSISYRIFVKGQVVEDGVSVFDMERVHRNYLEKGIIKNFEIAKDTFNKFEEILILETPLNADCAFACADIGESAPTEIAILFEIKNKYRYSYNITLYNLTDAQQYKVFKFLAEKLSLNFIGIDCTDGTGRAIYRRLAEIFPDENLCWVAFNEKIDVGFKKDPNDSEGKRILLDKDGEPVKEQEYVAIWSVKHLKNLLYDERMVLPIDYKLDMQLNSVIATQSSTRVTYHCTAGEDHLFQAFQVFAITQWKNEFANAQPLRGKRFCKTGV